MYAKDFCLLIYKKHVYIVILLLGIFNCNRDFIDSMSNNCQVLENSQRRLEAMDIGFHRMMLKPGKLHSWEKLAYGKRLIC